MKKKVKKNNIVKREFSLKEEYIKSWKYLGESKKFIFWIIGIFFLFTIIGFFIPPPEILSNTIMDLLKDLIQKTNGMNAFELILFIFSNNVQTSFSGMIFGFLFGIFPIITTLINGYLLGFVSAMSVSTEGFVSLLSLLPHGIFELPAVFISLGLGLKFGSFLFGAFLTLFKKKSGPAIIYAFLFIPIFFFPYHYLNIIKIFFNLRQSDVANHFFINQHHIMNILFIIAFNIN